MLSFPIQAAIGLIALLFKNSSVIQPMSKLLFSTAFCCWIVVVSISDLIGQTSQFDTLVHIPAIEVTASKIRQQTTGAINHEWTADICDKSSASNVAELLSSTQGIYLRNYGPGSLSTSSIRGGSAGHTLVLWNGLPIHSPMLGLLDLTLLPLQVTEKVRFTAGGNSTLWGSGAIGGVLNLENHANFSDNLMVKSSTRFGSFGKFQQHINVNLGNQKIQLVSKFSHQQARNDFHYFLADGIPERQQINARLNQQLIAQDIYWNIDNRNKLDFHFWWQQSNRQIPPTSVQNFSEAHQEDLATRMILHYKHLEKNGSWNLKAGFFNEHLNYFDDLILLESLSQYHTYLAEATKQWNWRNNHQFLIGTTHTLTKVWTQGYGNLQPTEYKNALLGSWKYQGKQFNSQVSLRQEIIDQSFVPLVPSVGIEWNFISTFNLKGKLSRNYRIPTFNDRFWAPGGNPDLLPESGWSQEMTLCYELKKSFLKFNAGVTAFNKQIDNWILWSRTEGQSFWSANNITKVWSRGLESRIQIEGTFKNTIVQLQGGYDYIRSTNEVAIQTPKIDAGEQLINTPLHHASSQFSVAHTNFYLAYQHSFTGSTKSVNEVLPSFQVGNLRLQYGTDIMKYRGTVFFNINNIWNADYLVVERRPMPGIHFETGLNLIFNKNK